MESRSRETTPTKEDLNFIVDDGYRQDVDPDYVPNDKYLVSGKEFKKLTQNAKKLGAESLDYSKRKNNKYMVTLESGKKVHFGSTKYADYLTHKDKERRDKYLARATKIKNKQGELTYNNPESANFWSVNLLGLKKFKRIKKIYNKMSSKGNDSLTSLSNYNDPACKYYVYDFNEENIKEKIIVLEEEIKEISRRLYFLDSIIENGLKK